MPLWVAAIIGGLIQAAGTLVGRVLVSLGMGYAVFTGVDAALVAMRDSVIAKIGGLPAAAVGVAATAKVGVCVSILFSALAARLLLDGLTSGTLKKLVIK